MDLDLVLRHGWNPLRVPEPEEARTDQSVSLAALVHDLLLLREVVSQRYQLDGQECSEPHKHGDRVEVSGSCRGFSFLFTNRSLITRGHLQPPASLTRLDIFAAVPDVMTC